MTKAKFGTWGRDVATPQLQAFVIRISLVIGGALAGH